MRRFLVIAIAGLSMTVALVPMSRADDNADPAIACEVAGYDVIIFSEGIAPIPAGTKVEWSVPFARAKGDHTLAHALEPGKAVFLTGALGSSYLDPDTHCLVFVE